MSKPQLSPVYSCTHEHMYHSWLVIRIKSKPVQSRLRRLLSRPLQLSHTNSSNPAHVMPFSRSRPPAASSTCWGRRALCIVPHQRQISQRSRTTLAKSRGNDRGRLRINLSDSLRDQVNKLRRCRQVVPVPTVGPFRFISYPPIKALVFPFVSLGPVVAK